MPAQYRDVVHEQTTMNAETVAGARERAAITVAISRELIAIAKTTVLEARLVLEESRRRREA